MRDDGLKVREGKRDVLFDVHQVDAESYIFKVSCDIDGDFKKVSKHIQKSFNSTSLRDLSFENQSGYFAAHYNLMDVPQSIHLARRKGGLFISYLNQQEVSEEYLSDPALHPSVVQNIVERFHESRGIITRNDKIKIEQMPLLKTVRTGFTQLLAAVNDYDVNDREGEEWKLDIPDNIGESMNDPEAKDFVNQFRKEFSKLKEKYSEEQSPKVEGPMTKLKGLVSEAEALLARGRLFEAVEPYADAMLQIEAWKNKRNNYANRHETNEFLDLMNRLNSICGEEKFVIRRPRK